MMPQEFTLTSANLSMPNYEESTLPNLLAKDQFSLENELFHERDPKMKKEELRVGEVKLTAKITGHR
jgi:hypothetical protein